MPVLDTKVWLCEKNGYILYEHYEKDVSNRAVLHAESAEPMSRKRNVHTQEILRRMLNTSPRLDWQKQGAPFIDDYMVRMRQAGYGEGFRRDVLQHAANIYARMRQEDENETRPMYRQKDYQRVERKKAKANKKHTWSTKGGYIAPIMVPPTPHSELAKMLRNVVEDERESGLKFKIVETGGIPIKSVQNSNPSATPGCPDRECVPCRNGRGEGGNCRRSNIQYNMECEMCTEDRPTVYTGETSRNLFTRAAEHYNNYRGRKDDSFILKHQHEVHGGAEAKFNAKVTHSFRDCLTRQVSEAVYIRRSEKEVLNSKSEWHQPALFTVRSEVVRG